MAFTIGMIWGIMTAKLNRNRMLGLSEIPRVEENQEPLQIDGAHPPKVESKLEFDRTTKMLLVVLITFLVTEIPDAVLTILHASLSTTLSQECLVPLIKFVFFLEYLSSVTSFFVYVNMSEAYRKTLLGVCR